MSAFRLRGFGQTDVGLRREHNEDYYHIDDDREVYVLADGMGGHASGEVASKIAVEQFAEFVTRTCRQEGFHWPHDVRGLATFEEKAVASGIRHANDRVFIESMRDRRYDGMGTTLCVVLGAGDRLILGHVGDSRIYRYRAGALTQLTEDHSLINHLKRSRNLSDEEVKSFASRNVIVRAVGLKDYVEPDVQTVDKRNADIYLLCSDGLSDLVEDWVMSQVLASTEGDLREGCDRLVRLANQRGGKDNITVILIQVEQVAARRSDNPAGTNPRTHSPVDTDVASVVIGSTRGQSPQARPRPDLSARSGAIPPFSVPGRTTEPTDEQTQPVRRVEARSSLGDFPTGDLPSPPPPPPPPPERAARPRDVLRETVPATGALRVGANRIGVGEDAGPPPNSSAPAESDDDPTIDMSRDSLAGEDGQRLRDTLRMPQVLASEAIRAARSEADTPTATAPPAPQATPSALHSLPPSAQSAVAPTQPSAPDSAARTRTDVMTVRPQPIPASFTADVPPREPSSSDSGEIHMTLPTGDTQNKPASTASAFGVANDPFDPHAVLGTELLRAIYRRARIAPLPPLPPGDEND